MDPLELVVAAAREAGDLLRARLDAPRDIAGKASDRDLVTDADRAAERAIVQRLRGACPGAAILGEEGGVYDGDARERFVVDPLDGTTNYAHRYPLFAVSIGLERDGVREAGCVVGPALGEVFAASRGRGATRNGAPMRVSATDRVARAMVCTGFDPSRYDRNGARFAALSRAARAVRRDGSAALDLAFVAAGIFDAFWERDLKPWDTCAGALLVEEAGGRVTALDGGPFRDDAGGILATNGRVHDEMIALLAAAGADD